MRLESDSSVADESVKNFMPESRKLLYQSRQTVTGADFVASDFDSFVWARGGSKIQRLSNVVITDALEINVSGSSQSNTFEFFSSRITISSDTRAALVIKESVARNGKEKCSRVYWGHSDWLRWLSLRALLSTGKIQSKLIMKKSEFLIGWFTNEFILISQSSRQIQMPMTKPSGQIWIAH